MLASRSSSQLAASILSTEDLSRILSGNGQSARNDPIGAKVVFTLGPTCCEMSTILAALKAGGVCARLLLGWGTPKFQNLCLVNLRAACQSSGKLCALMVETKGREVFVQSELHTDEETGVPFYNRSLSAKIDDKIVLTTRQLVDANTDWLLPVSLQSFPEFCSPGDNLILAEYLAIGTDSSTIHLQVVDVSGTDVICITTSAGTLEGNLVIRLLDRLTAAPKRASEPALSASDLSSLKSLATLDIDFLSLGHTQTAADIQFSRRLLASLGFGRIKILAQLETGRALVNSLDIMKQADGIILNRGSLAVNVAPGKLSVMQKAIISNSNLMGKPVLITSLSMSLTRSTVLSRSDVNDIVNAVMEGCDGLILSEETHSGLNPVQAISAVLCTAGHGEECANNDLHLKKLHEMLGDTTVPGSPENVSHGLVQAMLQCKENVGGCVAFCQTGVPIEAITRCHLNRPVLVPIASVRDMDKNGSLMAAQSFARQQCLYRDVTPINFASRAAFAGRNDIAHIVKAAVSEGLLREKGSLLIASSTSDDNQNLAVEVVDLKAILDSPVRANSDLQNAFDREEYEAALRESAQPSRPGTPRQYVANTEHPVQTLSPEMSQTLPERDQGGATTESAPVNGAEIMGSSPRSPMKEDGKGSENPSGSSGPSTPEQIFERQQSAPVHQLHDTQSDIGHPGQPETSRHQNGFATREDVQGLFRSRSTADAQQLLSAGMRSMPGPYTQNLARSVQNEPSSRWRAGSETPPAILTKHYNDEPQAGRSHNPSLFATESQLSRYATPLSVSPRRSLQAPSSYGQIGHESGDFGPASSRQRSHELSPAEIGYQPNPTYPQDEQVSFQTGHTTPVSPVARPPRRLADKSPFSRLREEPFPGAQSGNYAALGLGDAGYNETEYANGSHTQHTSSYARANGNVSPYTSRGRVTPPRHSQGYDAVDHGRPVEGQSDTGSMMKARQPEMRSYSRYPDGTQGRLTNENVEMYGQSGIQPDQRPGIGSFRGEWSGQPMRGEMSYNEQQEGFGLRNVASPKHGSYRGSQASHHAGPPYYDANGAASRERQNVQYPPFMQAHVGNRPLTPRNGAAYPDRPRDQVQTYMRSRVSTVDEARSILAGSRVRNPEITHGTSSRPLQGGNYSLPAPRMKMLAEDLSVTGYTPSERSLTPLQARRQPSSKFPASRKSRMPGTHRSMTPLDARQLDLPAGTPLESPRSQFATQPFATSDKYRAKSPMPTWHSRRAGALPESFEERPSLDTQSIPRVVGGKLVPSFQVGWRPDMPGRGQAGLDHLVSPEDSRPSSMLGNGVEYEEEGLSQDQVPYSGRHSGSESKIPSSADERSIRASSGNRSQSVPRGPRELQYERQNPPSRKPKKYENSLITTAPDEFLSKMQRNRSARNAANEAGPSRSSGQGVASKPTPPSEVSRQGQPSTNLDASQGKKAAEPVSEIQPEAIQRAPTPPALVASAPEGLIGSSSLQSPGSKSIAVSDLKNANGSTMSSGLSAAPSTAEEKMKEYLVGEGIKRAHLRAMYQKPAKPVKKGIFGRFFGGSKAKDESEAK